MNSKNPFDKCPVYETNNLIFTKVKEEDVAELYACYSDPITLSCMNNDNCGGAWDMCSIEVMTKGIKGWRQVFFIHKISSDFSLKILPLLYQMEC